jgi:hypothetical protein
VTVRFYEDWFVKTFYTTRVARVGELAAAAVVIRGWDVSRVVRVDARTSFYPCRTISTCTTCSMRATCAGNVQFSRRPIFEDGRSVATRGRYGRVDLRS